MTYTRKKSRIFPDKWKVLLVALCSLGSFALFAQSDGKAIFRQNCGACHTVTSQKLVGPGLEGISDKRKEDWLIKWIKDSQALIKSGDATANTVYNEYNKQAMPPFSLSDEEIKSILAYIKDPKAGETPKADAPKDAPVAKAEEKGFSRYLSTSVVITLSIILAVFVCLWYYLRSLDRQMKAHGHAGLRLVEKPIIEYVEDWAVKNKKLFAVVVIILLLIGLKGCWDTLAGIGVAQHYQPGQPINYSHKIHAGENKIACQYCHSGAYKGKTAGIPSANVCMNCHKYIREGKNTGKDEIAKIYKALDYNAETGEYGKNQNPIKWVRVHNLPDLAYFNHSQHVVVGKVECQQCHGQIQEMDTVSQHAPLTMGWCVDCHRKTEVKMAGNGYYKEVHEKFKKAYAGQAITVDKIGGLDCAKCHY